MSDEVLTYLIDTYADTILRLSYSYLKNVHDAEDVCQNIFIKLYNLNKEFKDKGHEKAYILHITANACKDILKSSWKNKIIDLESVKEIESKEIFSFVEDGVFQEVNKLDEKYRVVIYLHYYEGYKVKEIAKILRIPSPTVKTRLTRGRFKLKNILESDEL